MISIEQIKEPIQKEYEEFKIKFKEAFQSNNELINVVNKYILQKTGKQIRPLLTLLAAKSLGVINEDTYRCAIAMEMLHTASLIHDDVVDESNERRGQASVNSKWNNKISILIGDYLLSQSLSIANQTKNLKILDKITSLGKQLSEGELIQMDNVKNINCKEDKYFEVIKKKTASLFETCTYTGAVSVGASSEEIEKLRKFGEIYGICFQIKDDIFDYISSEKKIGKPVGNDIREGKITLPLIYALNQSEEKNTYLEIIKNKNFTKENIEKIINFAIQNKGIEYAKQKMREYQEKANLLLETIENQEIKHSLQLVLQHTIEREA
ncbi:MAG: polyprenyl synthetase family protein [Paludibacteraceae bacterium]|nr:polyprenyl synthetase family protein [Paludibacteraceae bacterium]MBR5973046.1 polyprenyl synthetase family protein [Paludibacteraceae bacterium]